MSPELRHGRFRLTSFIIINVVCLLAANLLAVWIYIDRSAANYSLDNYGSIILIMLVIDIGVTFLFNTLHLVLRRRKRKEYLENLRHIIICFVILAVILFSLRQGAAYSRVTVFLAYILDYVLMTVAHLGWRVLLAKTIRKKKRPSAILMTTDGFVSEGIRELRDLDLDVRYIYLLKNLNKKRIEGIPVLKTWEEAASAVCWEWIDKVYIYGLDHQMIPEYLTKACTEMGLKFDLVDFNYRVINITTIAHEDPRYGKLSFMEGKRDIPFSIRRVYWITETEAELHRGFHAHKLNCQLLFCPYGKIDIILDDGEEKNIVTLDSSGVGLILMPGLWREMVWKESGSVLCVLASEYYDPDEYIRDYDQFIAYSKKYRDAAVENTEAAEDK